MSGRSGVVENWYLIPDIPAGLVGGLASEVEYEVGFSSGGIVPWEAAGGSWKDGGIGGKFCVTAGLCGMGEEYAGMAALSTVAPSGGPMSGNGAAVVEEIEDMPEIMEAVVAVAVTVAVVAAAAVVLLETIRLVNVGGTVSGPAEILREAPSLRRFGYDMVPSTRRARLREAGAGGGMRGRSTYFSWRSRSGGVGDLDKPCGAEVGGGARHVVVSAIQVLLPSRLPCG